MLSVYKDSKRRVDMAQAPIPKATTTSRIIFCLLGIRRPLRRGSGRMTRTIEVRRLVPDTEKAIIFRSIHVPWTPSVAAQKAWMGQQLNMGPMTVQSPTRQRMAKTTRSSFCSARIRKTLKQYAVIDSLLRIKERL